MSTSFLIFIGAGLGGVLRYWLSYVLHWSLHVHRFPYGTLAVNISGCFLMGVFATLSLNRHYGSAFRSFLLVGFLGGYTTFSAFSIETINLLENGAWLSALINSVGSVLACLTAAWIGIFLARQL